MSININGASDNVKKINFTSSSVTDADVTKVLFNGTTVWAKPLQLVVALGGGVSSVQIQRTSTSEPSAKTDTKTITAKSVIPVYYGDTVKITPTAVYNYTLSGSWPKTYNIVENTSVDVNATSTATFLSSPVVTRRWNRRS